MKIGASYGTLVGEDGEDLIIAIDPSADAQAAMRRRMAASVYGG